MVFLWIRKMYPLNGIPSGVRAAIVDEENFERTGHGVLRHLKRPAAPECASRTPCSAALSPPAPYLTSGPTFVTLRRWKRTLFGFRLPANAPEGQKRFPSRLRS